MVVVQQIDMLVVLFYSLASTGPECPFSNIPGGLSAGGANRERYYFLGVSFGVS